MNRKKTKDVHVRLTPEDYAAARKVADLTGRTTCGLVQFALQHYLKKNYPHAYGNLSLAYEFEAEAAANGE